MNFLDWLLLILLAAYALSGYWQGFITGAFATVGLLAGGFLGIWVAPHLLGDVSPGLWVSLGALFIVILCATIGQALLQYAGARVRAKIHWQPVRALDAVGGAALSMAAVLLVAWALGVAISGSSLGPVTPVVRDSKVLAAVDRALPDQAFQGLQAFNDVVGTTFFPRYLEPFAPERIVAVDPPSPQVVRDPDVQRAGASVLKVHGNNSCGRGVEGSAFVIREDRLMTNAHVVAGVSDPKVLVGDRTVDAQVVYYNPQVDVAVLAVPDLGIQPLHFEAGVKPNDKVAILGYPLDGPYNVQSARVRAEQRLRSPDIYGHGSVLREVYSLRGLIRPGNSGGPLVDTAGNVVGVIFAASVSDRDTGYALTPGAVAEARDRGIAATTPVSTGGCAS
ncbi:MarP family serine protease [Nocardioides jejuensis]|uniref:MarP family serine protease n=1 Tax=Nocardioides jejuensis TaxID=2502782 RepID=A0A4R1CFD9_9ACTN|nr:MarP family serine protease [Nocardioides jejuensis]TCJ29880.1 MarP family serine protease [Nocardioides jejuensis]